MKYHLHGYLKGHLVEALFIDKYFCTGEALNTCAIISLGLFQKC